MKRATNGVLGLVVLCAMALDVFAQAPTGPQRKAYAVDFTIMQPYVPHSAVLRDGGLVVVGVAQRETPVEGRVFDAVGAQRATFTISQPPTGYNGGPSVAAVGDGFVVVWPQFDAGGSSVRILGQSYSASGGTQGSPFEILASRYVQRPNVAADASGGFVVAWTEYLGPGGSDDDVFARRYVAPGQPLGPPFLVNTDTAGRQDGPAAWAPLDVAADGSFLILWKSSAAAAPGLFARRFDTGGNPRGGALPVTTSVPDAAGCALQADGSLLVAWLRHEVSGSSAIYARLYDPAGAPVGSEIALGGAYFHASVTVVATAGGAFTVVWEGPDPILPLYRTIAADGTPAGPSTPVGYFPAVYSRAASDGAGGFSVSTFTNGTYELQFRGVLTRRYAAPAPAPAAALADDAAGGQSDGNRILEPGEGPVAFAPAWRNFDASPLSLSGSAVAFTGPGGDLYSIVDAAADYGTIAPGATANCRAQGDCYQLVLARPSARPADHWDATFDERLSTGPLQRWRLHVGESFSDVPRGGPYYRFVETLLHEGLSAGCGGGRFCPASPVTREQVAPFVLVAREGPGYRPSHNGPPEHPFSDLTNPAFMPFVVELARRGVVSGCGGGRYCPEDALTRAEAAVIALRVLDPALVPPACTTPRFGDVPASSPFCPWVEEMARRGVMAGCGGGNFCGGAALTREQLAVVLTQAFGLSASGF